METIKSNFERFHNPTDDGDKNAAMKLYADVGTLNLIKRSSSLK